MKAVMMTTEQTAIYDDDHDEAGQKKLMSDLMDRAWALAGNSGETVEIYTADGIVAAVVEPE